MRAVIQRVTAASVSVEGRVVGEIGPGLLVYVGMTTGDGDADVRYVADKISELRVFDDGTGRMNRSLADVGGAALVVSQFTLYGDARRGRRPSFDAALEPVAARQAYESLCGALRGRGVPVETGVFQAHMDVASHNDGPVTLLLDSRKAF